MEGLIRGIGHYSGLAEVNDAGNIDNLTHEELLAKAVAGLQFSPTPADRLFLLGELGTLCEKIKNPTWFDVNKLAIDQSGKTKADSQPNIQAFNSKTFNLLTKAIADFPSCYPEYKIKQPKLGPDLRPWLQSDYGATDREAHVFSVIIAEHFNF